MNFYPQPSARDHRVGACRLAGFLSRPGIDDGKAADAAIIEERADQRVPAGFDLCGYPIPA